jgi:hypothetical protein
MKYSEITKAEPQFDEFRQLIDYALWSKPLSLTQVLKRNGSTRINEDQKSAVQVVLSSLYDQSLKNHPEVKTKVDDFLIFKTANPTQQYGAKDTRFNSDQHLGQLKINHAHLSRDVSIFYRVSGKPTKLYVYGVFSHKESGTGTPYNNRIQKQLTQTLSTQFPDLNENFQVIFNQYVGSSEF